MVVATAVKECVGEKMIRDKVQEESGIISHKDTHLHEITILRLIRASLSMRYINDKEEKDYIKSLGIVYFDDKELKERRVKKIYGRVFICIYRNDGK
jgi:hypothetical protein